MANEDDEKSRGNGSGEPASGPKDEAERQATVEDLITELEKKLETSEQAAAELTDRWKRTAADFENFKRRTKKELDEGQQRGREHVIKELLPVLDNLERALKHATAEDPLAAGVR